MGASGQGALSKSSFFIWAPDRCQVAAPGARHHHPIRPGYIQMGGVFAELERRKSATASTPAPLGRGQRHEARPLHPRTGSRSIRTSVLQRVLGEPGGADRPRGVKIRRLHSLIVLPAKCMKFERAVPNIYLRRLGATDVSSSWRDAYFPAHAAATKPPAMQRKMRRRTSRSVGNLGAIYRVNRATCALAHRSAYGICAIPGAGTRSLAGSVVVALIFRCHLKRGTRKIGQGRSGSWLGRM
jgi:hypothetical protein